MKSKCLRWCPTEVRSVHHPETDKWQIQRFRIQFRGFKKFKTVFVVCHEVSHEVCVLCCVLCVKCEVRSGRTLPTLIFGMR